jgi:hypothetical protein
MLGRIVKTYVGGGGGVFDAAPRSKRSARVLVALPAVTLIHRHHNAATPTTSRLLRNVPPTPYSVAQEAAHRSTRKVGAIAH